MEKLTNFETFTAVDVVDVVAVLTQVLGVGIVESQTVTAYFQFGNTLGTFPVFVAGDIVREVAGFLWTGKRVLSRS